MARKKVPEILDKNRLQISKIRDDQLELAKTLYETNKTGIADPLATLQKIPIQNRTDSIYTRILQTLTQESNNINDSWYSIIRELMDEIEKMEDNALKKELQRYYQEKRTSD